MNDDTPARSAPANRREDLHLPDPIRYPDTALEEAVASAFAGAFTLDRVSMDDDFFALGGDSLIAETLALLLSGLGLGDFAMSDLYDISTPAAVAATLEARASGTRDADMAEAEGLYTCFPLNAGPTAPVDALAFFVWQGLLSDYFELAHLMSGRMRLTGIRPQRTLEFWTALPALEDLARTAADTLQRRPTPGAQRLMLGYSFGGILAFETARILMERGEPAPLVAMIDPATPWAGRLSLPRWLYRTWRQEGGGEVLRLAKALARGSAQGLELIETRELAMRSYDPAPAALPRALLVVPEIGEADTLAQRQAAWRGLVGPGLTVETVPGDHLSMLRGAGAVSVANVLTGWLGR